MKSPHYCHVQLLTGDVVNLRDELVEATLMELDEYHGIQKAAKALR